MPETKTKAKHTKGPWEVVRYGGHIEVQQSDPDGHCIVQGMGSDNPEADAQLIAAAPDLLEACEAYLRELSYLQDLWGKEGITDAIAKRLKCVIAKAIGETS